MGKVSEVDAIKSVDDALSALEDAGARDRVLRWAWEKYATNPAPSKDSGEAEDATSESLGSRKKKSASKKGKTKKSRPKQSSLSIEKGLNLKPKGKKSFDSFVEEKQPKANHEKCTVAVYYLHHELDQPKIGASHVLTCFKHMKWRVPADLPNALAWTASTKGLLDTKKMGDIRVTTIGENLVEHDLAHTPKK